LLRQPSWLTISHSLSSTHDFKGKASLIEVSQSVYTRYFVFLIMNVFLVSTIAGSFFNKVFAILEGEERLIDLLAESLPGQGGFFIEYVMVKFAVLTLNKV